MVTAGPSRRVGLAVVATALVLIATVPAFAQDGSVLTNLENQVVTATRGWQATVMDAARSLFWILAAIEIGIDHRPVTNR